MGVWLDLPAPEEGQALSAGWLAKLLAYVRSLSPTSAPGSGIQVVQTAGGTSFSLIRTKQKWMTTTANIDPAVYNSDGSITVGAGMGTPFLFDGRGALLPAGSAVPCWSVVPTAIPSGSTVFCSETDNVLFITAIVCSSTGG